MGNITNAKREELLEGIYATSSIEEFKIMVPAWDYHGFYLRLRQGPTVIRDYSQTKGQSNFLKAANLWLRRYKLGSISMVKISDDEFIATLKR